MCRIKAIALEGDDLIVGDGTGTLQCQTKDGDALEAPFQHAGGFADTEGIAVSANGDIVTIEDDPERLSRFNSSGDLKRRINTLELFPPLSGAQGIPIDERTVHPLIVDD
ncbi:MAG: hypothetical protein AAF968_02565 [Pseudomonadota bacterium]